MSDFAGHIYSWLAIAYQEKIANFLGVNGYIHMYMEYIQGAKIGCFIYVCLFSIVGIISICTK